MSRTAENAAPFLQVSDMLRDRQSRQARLHGSNILIRDPALKTYFIEVVIMLIVLFELHETVKNLNLGILIQRGAGLGVSHSNLGMFQQMEAVFTDFRQCVFGLCGRCHRQSQKDTGQYSGHETKFIYQSTFFLGFLQRRFGKVIN
jgi:hypothetical protein